MLTNKYNDANNFYRIYQMKENTKCQPFEEQAFNLMNDRQKQKFQKYIFGQYKGENDLGIPNGEGHIKFDLK